MAVLWLNMPSAQDFREAVLGGVLGTSTGFSMDQKRGQAVLAVRNGPGLTSRGIPVTFSKLPPKVLLPQRLLPQQG